MHFLQAINSDISVLTVCNNTGGTIKGDIKKRYKYNPLIVHMAIIYVLYVRNAQLLIIRGKNGENLKVRTVVF